MGTSETLTFNPRTSMALLTIFSWLTGDTTCSYVQMPVGSVTAVFQEAAREAGIRMRMSLAAVMLALIVIVLGLVSFLRLPIDLMPDITYPTLSISTSYANASPEEMEEIITRPIEGAMAAVPGVEEISSTSSETPRTASSIETVEPLT